MDTIVERCCGLDVHQAVIVASVLIGEPGKRVQKQTRSFRALTAGLSELQQWLREQGVTHVAMEATGIYWVPVYAHLEGQFELIVGNATHIKSVPGRKSAWVAWASDAAGFNEIVLSRLDGARRVVLEVPEVVCGEPAFGLREGRVLLAWTALPSVDAKWRALYVADVTGAAW